MQRLTGAVTAHCDHILKSQPVNIFQQQHPTPHCQPVAPQDALSFLQHDGQRVIVGIEFDTLDDRIQGGF